MSWILFVVAVVGWLAALICFLCLVLAAFTISAQEARFRDEFSNLKRTYERAILMRPRGKSNN